ncbi:MAG: transporter substrate-binding domain-containing protein [Pseudomonadota bacterium]
MSLAKNRELHRILLSLVFCACFVFPALALEKVRYPVSRFADIDSHDDYTVEMLRLAIQKSGVNLSLQPVRTDLNKIRTLAELKDGTALDVVWGGAYKEREAAMLPIRICLMKGLMGWRIPLVTKKNSHMFAKVENLNDLRQFTAGQGYHWTDTQVLLASGIKVERSYEFEFLFRMLEAGRFDYFPRSLMEIWNEFDTHQEMDLAIDTHIVIHYPAAFYFYVKKGNKELASIIQRGLEAAIKDGSFDKLFYAFHKKEIINAGLENRKVIELSNPFLTPETPLARKELWFGIKDLKKIEH